MSRKLLLFGGLSAVSIATVIPTGIHLHKEIEQKKAEKERQKFISRSNVAVDKLNNVSKDPQVLFLKNSEDDDKWKLMWIWDVYKWYSKQVLDKTTWNYKKEGMQKVEKLHWDNQVLKQQGKWEKQMENQWLNQANAKTQYWEKFKEICLILMVNGKIDENENMGASSDNHEKLLCNFVSYHQQQWTVYEEHKKTANPPLEIMEYFWTVQAKSAAVSGK